MMSFPINNAFVRRNLASSFQAREIRVSEITRVSRSIAFHRSDRRLREKTPAIY
jgi:hypothetical protein